MNEAHATRSMSFCCMIRDGPDDGAFTSAKDRKAQTCASTSTKAGSKASGAVRRFGVRLLPELVEHLNKGQVPLSRRLVEMDEKAPPIGAPLALTSVGLAVTITLCPSSAPNLSTIAITRATPFGTNGLRENQ